MSDASYNFIFFFFFLTLVRSGNHQTLLCLKKTPFFQQQKKLQNNVLKYPPPPPGSFTEMAEPISFLFVADDGFGLSDRREKKRLFNLQTF